MTQTPPTPTPSKQRLHESLIVALMAGSSIADAATAAGISRSTAQRWLAGNKAFRRRYAAARRAAVGAAVGHLHQHAGSAVATLLEIHADKQTQAAVRVQAAGAILAWAAKFSEQLDLEDELRQLKESLDKVKGDRRA